MIKIDLDKAKEIAHTKRREARTAEFTTLDMQSTIPALAVEAEEKRQVVRDKYATVQTEIDSSSNVDELKAILDTL